MTLSTISEFFFSAWSGVIGNVLFLGALTLFAYSLKFLPKRKRLREFFLKGRKKIHVILSHVRVIPSGAMGVYGGTFSFAGSTVPIMESMVAQKFRGALLSPVPGLTNQPGLLSSILIDEFSVEIAPSSLIEANIPNDGTLIAVGGPAFNAASNLIERDLKPLARLSSGIPGTTFASGAVFTDLTVGFITRLFDSDNSRYIFYIAGPSEEATAVSLQYLIENWLELELRFKGKDKFAVSIRVISTSPLRGKLEHTEG